mmetsp:Transcript_59361/g.170554  ORF Transcript_59361/g.170554 Transcript_59361/m.170554 type:complete len:208 (-) Transcript_59361:215-838(-)
MQAGASDRAVDGRWRIATSQAHHVRIPLVLLHWICEAVADGHALEVDVLVALLQVRVALEDAMCDSRDVVTSVALARDVEVLVVLRHGLEKHLQELVHVLGNTVLVVVPCALGETRARGLVDPHDVGAIGPRVRIQRRSLSVSLDLARSVLKEEPGHRRAAGASRQPHDHGVLGRIVAALKHPEEVLLLLAEGEVATVLLHIGIAEP